MFFRNKKIVLQETVGEYLKKVRQAQEVSLFDIASEIKISFKYLQAIEQGQYNLIPGEVYLKNFIKAYGLYLHLNTKELLKRYDREKHILKNLTLKKREVPLERTLTEFLLSPKFIRLGVISLVFLLLFTYVGWELYSSVKTDL